jgi:cyanophycinase
MKGGQIKKYQQKNDCPTPNGTLMIIGGGHQREVVMKEFFSLIEHKNPIIEVITTAGSEDVEETFKEYKDLLQKFGDCTVNQMHHEKRELIDEAESEERLNAAHAVFIAGGDQLKLTSIYGGTSFLFLMTHRYIYENLLVGGTSAGAMALSTPMIYAGTGEKEMIAGAIKVTLGFEFLRDVCIDTHFVERGRTIRLAQVIATNLSTIGLGIEEDTAVIVRNGTEAVVTGCGVVMIMDGKNSYGSNVTQFNEDLKLTIRNLQISILSGGEKFEIPQMNPPHK